LEDNADGAGVGSRDGAPEKGRDVVGLSLGEIEGPCDGTLEAKYVGENVGVTGDRVVVGEPGSAMESLDDGATKDTEEGLPDGNEISRGSALGPKEGLCEATTLHGWRKRGFLWRCS
jgi:hypothetical protein